MATLDGDPVRLAIGAESDEDALGAPPQYSPSSSTPTYTFNPRDDEQRLAIATRDGWLGQSALSGAVVVVNKRSGITLRINRQEEGVTLPTFGRNAIINGVVTLKSIKDVLRVEVELEGYLKLTIAEGGKKTRNLFKATRSIWVKGGENSSRCPELLEFLVQMPSSYTDSRTRSLPPSYQIIFPGVPGLFAHTVYTLTIRVIRGRKMLWKRTDELLTEIKYQPRTRAPRPIVKQALCFFMLLKIAPEEFCQVSSVMEARAGSGFEPVHCQLFIPSSCIYAMTEEIPFHLQLVAPMSSLLAFSFPYAHSRFSRVSTIAQLQSHLSSSGVPVTPGAPLLSSSTSGASLRSSSTLSASIMQNLNSLSMGLGVGAASKSLRRPVIRVFLLRQITVEVRGQKAWRTCVLGEGKVSPSPPGPTSASFYNPNLRARVPSFMNGHPRTSTSASDGPIAPLAMQNSSDPDPVEALDWDGTVKVANPAEIQVGGFAAGSLVVKDFIVLSLVPPDPSRNPLIEHQYAHPIRLVTDPLEDNWDA